MIRKIYKFFGVASLCLFLLTSIHAIAQKRLVTGKISDATGPLPGVNLILKGTTIGTTSNANGEYSLEVDAGDILVASFIGYRTKEVPVGNQTQISIVMEADISTLEEIVVVGYGEQKKKLVTGANVQVTGETLQKQN